MTTVLLVAAAAWIFVGLFVLAAIVRHSADPLDYRSAVGLIAIAFIVLAWPVIIWEYSRIAGGRPSHEPFRQTVTR